jgi:endonuclease/exonuclease/phosphatase family metal-dependent hydrolase
MGFKLLSWNVESFDGNGAQLADVTDRIEHHSPDVFGLFEVESLAVLDLMRKHLPDYDYSLTDGPQNKEILVGVRRTKFTQVVFSQKREFKVYNPYLRPGALVTLETGGKLYNLLFLHTDSGTEARDFGNRYQMIEKIWSLRLALGKLADHLAQENRFVALGDLNTMGMLFPYRKKSDERVSEEEEIEALREYASRRNMVLLRKELDATWSDGRIESDLDHVLATNETTFTSLGQRDDGEPFSVMVRGWQQLQGTERLNFIEHVSDHCFLYCEIE